MACYLFSCANELKNSFYIFKYLEKSKEEYYFVTREKHMKFRFVSINKFHSSRY